MAYNTATEQKIITSASEIFLKKGYSGARMQEIADKAGINKALLHYYFRSKEKLFRTIFKRELKVMLTTLFSSISFNEDFQRFLKEFIHTYLKNISARQTIIRFVLWELQNSAEEIVDCFLEVFKEIGFEENPLILRVQKAIDDQEIRAVDPANFVISLIGMCIFPFVAFPLLEHIIPDFNINDPDFLRSRENAIFELLWEGLKINN
jgi:AcrR family transcriptional regulator